eukprot:6269368-Amphidinium_carterae.1
MERTRVEELEQAAIDFMSRLDVDQSNEVTLQVAMVEMGGEQLKHDLSKVPAEKIPKMLCCLLGVRCTVTFAPYDRRKMVLVLFTRLAYGCMLTAGA